MFGERGFVRWHLEDDGAGEVRLDGRSAGETPWPPAWG